jgi:heat shock protein HslJ
LNHQLQATTMRALSILVAPLLLLAACAGTGKDSGPVLINAQTLDRLVDREWELKTITVDNTRIIMHVDSTQTLRFGSDGKITGFAAVNRFGGTYKFSPDGVLSFPGPGLISTRMAGPPELMEKERAYLNGLPKTTRAVVAKNALQLQNEDGSTVLTFTEIGK